jgi:hypothetical protein
MGGRFDPLVRRQRHAHLIRPTAFDGKDGVLPENARMFQAFDIACLSVAACSENPLLTAVR